MIKVFYILGALLLAGIAVVALLASSKPDSFRVERSIVLNAPPERAFALIQDLRQFNRWNPWLRKDPAAQQRYGDTTAGAGAHYAWESSKIGTGSMTIAQVTAPSEVSIKLDFVKPFEGHNMAQFTVRAEGTATRVTWAMHGPANAISKVMQVFISMDAMIGKDFEEGLANLKALAEAPAGAAQS